MVNLGTLLFTKFYGKEVGKDNEGNRYYESKASKKSASRRWVIYKKNIEASAIPAEWQSWLTHMTISPLSTGSTRLWQKSHKPNQTGTKEGYERYRYQLNLAIARKEGKDLYEAWKPS